MSIVYLSLLCRDFSSFTAKFNDYGSSVITVYIILNSLGAKSEKKPRKWISLHPPARFV